MKESWRDSQTLLGNKQKYDTKYDTENNVPSIYAGFTIFVVGFKSCYLHQSKKPHDCWEIQCSCGFSLFLKRNLAYFLITNSP